MNFKKLKKFLIGLATLGMLSSCGTQGPGSGSGNGDDVKTPYYVSYNASEITVTGLNERGEYYAGDPVSFTAVAVDSANKTLTNVTASGVTITKGESGYSFVMPEKDVDLVPEFKIIDHYEMAISDTAKVGEEVMVILSNNGQEVSTWTLSVGEEDAQKVTIDDASKTFTMLSETTITLQAKVNGEVVATKEVTASLSLDKMTIAQVIDHAWKTVNDNSKSTYTDDKYTVVGKVVAEGTPYNGYVEMIIDDGTAPIIYRLKSSVATNYLGKVIQIKESVQNYYGTFEMTSSDAKYITEVTNKDITPTAAVEMSGAQYDAFIESIAEADGETVSIKPTLIVPKHLKIRATAASANNRFNIVDSAEALPSNGGLIATTKSNPAPAHVVGVEYGLEGYFHSYNASSKYSNFVVTNQEMPAATDFTLSASELTTFIGIDRQLSYTVTAPEGAVGNVVAWTSVDPSVATVDQTGKVTGVSAGSTTVKCVIDGVEKTCAVTVSGEFVQATSISFPAETKAMKVFEEVESFALTTVPEVISSIPEVTVSDETVVTYEDGKLTALKAGTATITATVDGLTATCVVTVSNHSFADIANLVGEKVSLDGFVTGDTSDSYKDYFIGDASGAAFVYTNLPDGVSNGDAMHVEGTVKSYNGLLEIDPVTVQTKYETAPQGLTQPTELTIDEAKIGNFAPADQAKKASVSGVVKTLSKAWSAGNNDVKMTLTVGEKTVDVFVKKSNLHYADWTAISVGMDVTVKGFVGTNGSKNAQPSEVEQSQYQVVYPYEIQFVMPDLTGINISSDKLNISVEGTKELSISSDPSGLALDGAKATWSVDNDNVTLSSSNGLSVDVTAAKVGTSTVTVSYAKDDTTTYTKTCEVTVKAQLVGLATDVLTTETFGSPSSYSEWSNKKATEGSNAVYAGNSTTNSGNIQIRSDKSTSGIVTTASGGYARLITVVFASSTTSGRTIDVYSNTSAFTSPTELYGAAEPIAKIGSIKYEKGVETVEFEVPGDVEFIGLRSNNGAIYIASITISWQAK